MPTRTSEKDRKKAFAPKVRTGCESCKLRRVKCGEENPSCGEIIVTTVRWVLAEC